MSGISNSSRSSSGGNDALGRLIRREFSPDELPSLIETIFVRSDVSDEVRCLGEGNAQAFIDVIDEVVLSQPDLSPRTRVICLRQLYKTCGHHELIPKSLEVPICYDRNGFPKYHGGYADVWKGELDGREVAVKVIRTYSTSDLQKIVGRFCKELVTWKVLRHPNVLPLIGVTMSRAHFAMVSEWMYNGNINEFVKANPDKNRLELLGDVARGLIYIHQQEMIHGDLKGANILIDQTGHALLADFGLLTIISNPEVFLPSSSPAQGGTTRWMSPELIDPQAFELETHCPTKHSDCYAFGMVIYETISGNVPFHKDAVPMVIVKVLRGENPHRSMEFTEEGLWEIMKKCWTFRASERPSIEQVLQHLDMHSNLQVLPSPGMDLMKGGSPIPTLPNLKRKRRICNRTRIFETLEYIPANPFTLLPTRRDLRAVAQARYQNENFVRSWNPLPPIDFAVQGKEGISLRDAMDLNFSHLDGRNDPMFVDERIGNSVLLRLEFMFLGYQSGRKRIGQFATRNHKKERSPITRRKLGYDVAKLIKAHLQDGSPIDAPFENMYLVRLHNVSKASWQPELWYSTV